MMKAARLLSRRSWVRSPPPLPNHFIQLHLIVHLLTECGLLTSGLIFSVFFDSSGILDSAGCAEKLEIWSRNISKQPGSFRHHHCVCFSLSGTRSFLGSCGTIIGLGAYTFQSSVFGSARL